MNCTTSNSPPLHQSTLATVGQGPLESRKAPFYRRPLLLFAIALAGIFASIAGSYIMRRTVVPPEIQYVPKESTVILAVGDIKSVWEGVQRHFGFLLSDDNHTTEEGSISKVLREVKQFFDAAGMPLTSPEDLERHGFDTRKGMFLAMEELPTSKGVPQFIAVFHVHDEPSAYLSFLESVLGSKLSRESENLGGVGTRNSVRVFRDGLLVAHPEAGLLVLSNSRSLLSSSLLKSTENYSYFINNDRFYRGVRHSLAIHLLRGPALFFWISQAGPYVRDIGGAIRFRLDDIQILADCDVRDTQLRVIRDFMTRSSQDQHWASALPFNTAGSAVFQDHAISTYLQFLGSFGKVSRFMREQYGGLLWRLRGVKGLTQVSVAVTGFQGGLPDVALGFKGDTASLSRALEELQVDMREDRDGFLLKSAREVSARKESTGADLAKTGYLQPEPFGLFDRYHLEGGEFEAELRRSDFDNSSYVTEYEGHRIEYLLPPLTMNDLRYRPELKNLQASALEDNHYRLPFATIGSSVWACTDLRGLQALIDQNEKPTDTLQNSPRFQLVHSSDPDAKIYIMLNLDEAISLGLVDPESSVEKWVRANLLDLRGHSAVGLGVSVLGRNRARIRVILARKNQ